MMDRDQLWQTSLDIHVGPNANPACDDNAPIFVFASSHRSGTTLLQRLLNSHPRIMIWGEQDGYVDRWMSEFKRFEDWTAEKSSELDEYLSAGSNRFLPNLCPRPRDLTLAARAHLVSLFCLPAHDLGRTIWGFKEVRYAADVALWLQQLFPRARFIHLTRNVADVLLSLKRWELTGSWQQEWTQDTLRRWPVINNSFMRSGESFRKLLTVRYEDMVAQSGTFTGELESFLDLGSGTLNRNVFKLKLDGTEPEAPREALTRRDHDRLRSTPDLVDVAERLGYEMPF